MNLVLEYVEGGHLFDYMQQTPPPQTNKDIHALWTSIVGILKGCHHIHQWTQHPQFAETSRLVHQDLKPQNILIVKGPSSRYDFDPKVADFGCSHVLKDPQKLSPDRHGNPTYSAPECSHHAPDLFPGPDVFTPAADIFALGCILSEVAAWVAEGIDMIETYRSWRQEEIARNPHFADSAYSEGFHNGADVLQAFPMLQNYITTSCPGDLVTSEILHVVGSHMLVGRPERRSSAKEIICKLQHVLDSARDDRDDWKRPGEGSPPGVPTVVESVHTTTPPDASASPTPSNCLAPSGAEALTPTLPIYRRNPDHDTTAAPYTGQSSSSPMGIEYPTRNKSKRSKFHDFKRFSMNGSNGSLLHGRPSMPTNPSDPSSADGILTINDILQYREARKDKRDPAPGVHYLVAKLRSNLARRDHVFFVDDTQSMYTHRAELIRAFTAFSYLAKLIDRDGIELIFASNPRKIWKDSATSRLIDILERHQFVQESGMMEGKLGELVDHIVTDRLPMTIRGHQMNLLPKKEVSIFVLTDGCWHNNLPDLPNAAGVKAPIERLMRIIHDKGLNRTQVMIQFIRFGNDENGKRYLELLDDFGQDTGRYVYP